MKVLNKVCLLMPPGIVTTALLVLATYEKLLVTKGLRYLLLLNLSCSALGVFFSTFVCRFSFSHSFLPPLY